MAEIFRFSNLAEQPNLIHGVATAEYGNMSFKFGEIETVRAARKKFFDDLRVSDSQVAVTQLIHGSEIIDVTTLDRGKGTDSPTSVLSGDILVTSEPDTYLFFSVADCLALFFFEPVKKVVALAHAGWRGVQQQVPKITVEYLVSHYQCDPKQLLVGISPALQVDSACFPKTNQERRQILSDHPAWQKYVNENDGKICINVTDYAYDQLLSVGIPTNNIERSTIDTRHDPNFFSHRRSQEKNLPEQRFGCLIGIKS